LSGDSNRRLGEKLADLEFSDEDGAVVTVQLNLDNHNNLYELDVWKTDFSPLKRFPD
jgi:hypothetical protein